MGSEIQVGVGLEIKCKEEYKKYANGILWSRNTKRFIWNCIIPLEFYGVDGIQRVSSF